MSRCLLALTVTGLLTVPVAAQETAEAVLQKAIEAHGGAEALNKYPAGVYKLKGDMALFDMNLDFTGEIVYQLPDKFRMSINTELGGQKLAVVQVVNGKQVKNLLNGQPMPVGEAEKAELRQAALMQEVSQLTPLLKKEKYTLKLEKSEDVNGKPALVVLVTAKDFKDTRLYFDKQSGLLVKTSRRGLAPSMGEPKEITEDTLLSDFKKVEGIQTPMKMLVNHDDKKFMSITVTEVKMLEKADPQAFAVDD